MKDQQALFAKFQEEHAKVYEAYEHFGIELHKSGPLDEKTRWLIKVAISAADRFNRALKVHITKAREAGATKQEITHAVVLIAPTVGFPTMMNAYGVLDEMFG